jgi:hypothetical protein
MNKDDIKKYVVCINGGSGVIFQPMDNAYTYILTAQHLFDNVQQQYNGEIRIEYFDASAAGFQTIPAFQLIKDTNYFPHEDNAVDIALIKVSRISTPADLYLLDDLLKHDRDYFLAGYPEMRRSKTGLNRFRLDIDVTMLQDKEDQRREADISKNPTKNELNGQSGGGFFKIIDGRLFLAGIQAQISVEKEQLGKVELTPVEVFSQIIIGNLALLEQLVPYYMKGFDCLKDNAFVLPMDIATKAVIEKISRVIQRKLTDTCNSDFTPMCIKEQLGDSRLLIAGQDNQMVYLRSLWVLWLELLAIVAIATGKIVVKADFEDLFSKLRLLHSETEKDFWIEHLHDVVNTDFGSLADDGLVIISCKNQPRAEQYILNKDDILEEIGWVQFDPDPPAVTDTPYGAEAVDIYAGGRSPFDRFKFIHIEFFKRKLIVEDFKEYAQLTNPIDILDRLKQKYEQYIQ